MFSSSALSGQCPWSGVLTFGLSSAEGKRSANETKESRTS